MPMQHKIQTQGAHHLGAHIVKTEPADDAEYRALEVQMTPISRPDSSGGPAVQPESRQLLKQRIIQKRRARGEEDIDVHFPKPVKHELSAVDIERRERRKEQNRRAARKCRQKKKLQQVDVAQCFTEIQKENQRLEQEVITLRKEKAELEKTLDNHLRSGLCQHVKAELQDASMQPQPLLAPPAVPVTSLSVPVTSVVPSFDSTQYLQGLGPMEPSETFMDLGSLVAAEEAGAQSVPPQASCAEQPFDALKMLDGLTPVTSPCLADLLSPISPVSDRHSVSSVSSDWSSLSDQSRGFCLDGYGGSANQRLSLAEMDGREEQSLYQAIPVTQAPYGAEDDSEDDVFAELGQTIPSDAVFRRYTQVYTD